MYIRPLTPKYTSLTSDIHRQQYNLQVNVIFKGHDAAENMVRQRTDLAVRQLAYWFDWLLTATSLDHPNSALSSYQTGHLTLQSVAPDIRELILAGHFAYQEAVKLGFHEINVTNLITPLIMPYGMQKGASQHLLTLLEEPEIAAVSLRSTESRVVLTSLNEADWAWSLDINGQLLTVKNGTRVVATALNGNRASVVSKSAIDAAIWANLLIAPNFKTTLSPTIPGFATLTTSAPTLIWQNTKEIPYEHRT
jgi:hypothetical protein